MSKACSRCKEVKALADFYKSAKERDGHMHRCKACDLEAGRERKEQKREYAKAYVKTEAYKQRRAEKRRKNTLARTQRKLDLFASLTDMQIRRWRVNAAARYMHRLQATPKWLTATQKQRTLEIYAATQHLQELTATVYHVDHIVPLRGETVCGLHVWWNLQPLIERDNIFKQNMFDPSIFPSQGEVAFPDGAGPTTARTAVPLEKVKQSDE